MTKYDFSSTTYSHGQTFEKDTGNPRGENVMIHNNAAHGGLELTEFSYIKNTELIPGQFLCFCARPDDPTHMAWANPHKKWERSVSFDLDQDEYKLEIYYLPGNNKNGLEKPDNNEDLLLRLNGSRGGVDVYAQIVLWDCDAWVAGDHSSLTTTDNDSPWWKATVDISKLAETQPGVRFSSLSIFAEAIVPEERIDDGADGLESTGIKPNRVDAYAIQKIKLYKPEADICFPAGTPVTTDQGPIAIEKLIPGTHTIKEKPILGISQTKSSDNHLLCFEKHALGHNTPNKQTIMSREHCILYKGKMKRACTFMRYARIRKMKYTGETLYNVVLEKHGSMSVNNMTVETLHPKHWVAKKILSSTFRKS